MDERTKNRVLALLSEDFGPSMVLALSGVELDNDHGRLDVTPFLSLYHETGHEPPPFVSQASKKKKTVVALSHFTKALLDDFRIEMMKNGVPLRYYDDIILYLLSHVCIHGCTRKYTYNFDYLTGKKDVGGDEI